MPIIVKRPVSFVLFILFCTGLTAQKPCIDTFTFGKWPQLMGSAYISHDGKYAYYTISNQPLKSQTLIIQSTANAWKRVFEGVNDATFSSDGKQIIFKTAGDSLCIFTLEKDEMQVVSIVGKYTQYALSGSSEECLAYELDTAMRQLVLLNLRSDKKRNFTSVVDFFFSPDGNSLIIEEEDNKDSSLRYDLEWLNIADGQLKTIWKGIHKAANFAFSIGSDQLVFKSGRVKDSIEIDEIWQFKMGFDNASLLVSSLNLRADSNLSISDEPFQFSKDGDILFLKLIEKTLLLAKPGAVKVDVWNYKDAYLQSSQLSRLGKRVYAAAINIHDKRLMRLQKKEETVLEGNDDYLLVLSSNGNVEEYWWNPKSKATIYLVATHDGSRRKVCDKLSNTQFYNFNFPPSTNGRWLIYFDQDKSTYFSLNLWNGVSQNITKGIATNLAISNGGGGGNTKPTPGLINPPLIRIGVAGWFEQDTAILIYDEYDVWKVDPAGIKVPENITNGYGRAHRIQFRLSEEAGFVTARLVFNQKKLIMRAFNTENKYSGFYQKDPGKKGDPEFLTMGPWSFSTIISKARDTSVWIITRMNDKVPTNYYISRDLRSFVPLSIVEPQKDYNWLTAELIHWNTLDGSRCEGILYKPENFNPAQKYPVIFYYYEKLSDELYDFREPGISAAGINIPYFVSRGYLVCIPDIHYKVGSPGEGVVNCVLSAAKYLSKLSFVDGHKMGINGQSWGGYQTNYLVTHTHIFAAAAEMAGPTDFISGYGSIRLGVKRGLGGSAQDMYELYQCRIGATLWQRPDLYIRNSPIFRADQVTTPLLMAHSWKDNNVAFEQSVELYTGLRRLGKRVWLLQYDNGGHVVAGARDGMDYTIRLTQFFDHYLKNVPPPKWMTKGIPARLKGIETGYELDFSGKQP